MAANIRPALDTLRALKDGQTLDEIALRLNEACNAVTELGKSAEVVVRIKVSPFVQKGTKLVEHPIVMTAEVTAKLPKPTASGTVFFVDEDGNPTQNQPRKEPQLNLSIAGAATK